MTHHPYSVTVMHEDPAWADAWDTALLCAGEREAARIAEVERLKVVLVSNGDAKPDEHMSKAFLASQ